MQHRCRALRRRRRSGDRGGRGQRRQPLALAFAGDLGILDARRVDLDDHEVAGQPREFAADDSEVEPGLDDRADDGARPADC